MSDDIIENAIKIVIGIAAAIVVFLLVRWIFIDPILRILKAIVEKL